MMIEAAQVRAARALIGWSRAELAKAAGLPLAGVELVELIEAGSANKAPAGTFAKMRAALESAGVAFIPEGGGSGAGVRLRKGGKSEYIDWGDLNASNDE